jgi:hypothetical protein
MPQTNQNPTPLRRKIDRFWSGLFLTPEGRPKSAKLLYAFCLSIVFMLVYGLCYWFLIDPLEQAFASSPAYVRNLFEAIVPGLLGSIPCCAMWFVFKDKSYLPFIYGWLTLFALAALVSLLALTEQGARGVMMRVYLMLVPTGLITGSVFCWLMYVRWRRSRTPQKNNAAG